MQAVTSVFSQNAIFSRCAKVWTSLCHCRLADQISISSGRTTLSHPHRRNAIVPPRARRACKSARGVHFFPGVGCIFTCRALRAIWPRAIPTNPAERKCTEHFSFARGSVGVGAVLRATPGSEGNMSIACSNNLQHSSIPSVP